MTFEDRVGKCIDAGVKALDKGVQALEFVRATYYRTMFRFFPPTPPPRNAVVSKITGSVLRYGFVDFAQYKQGPSAFNPITEEQISVRDPGLAWAVPLHHTKVVNGRFIEMDDTEKMLADAEHNAVKA